MKAHTAKETPLVAVKSGTDAGLWVNLNSYKPDGVVSENRLFWDPAFYEVVKTDLGRFLPSVERQRDGLPEARYYLYRNTSPNVELCSSSRPVNEAGVPEAELALLRRAVVEFQRKTEDPTVQHKDLLEAFRLPDPVNCPELYRVDLNGQLMVLWGCRREELSNLPGRGTVSPAEAVQQLVKYPKASNGSSRFPWAWLVPLLLLLLLGGWLLQHPDDAKKCVATIKDYINGLGGEQSTVGVIPPPPPPQEHKQFLVVSWSPENGEAPVLIKASAKKAGTIQIGSYDRQAVEADQWVSAPPFTEEGQVLVTWEPKAPNSEKLNGEFMTVAVKKATADIIKPEPFVGDLRIRPLSELPVEGGATKGRYAAEVNLLNGIAPKLVRHAWEVWPADKKAEKPFASYDKGDEVFFVFRPGKYLIKLKAEDKVGKVLTAELARSFGADEVPKDGRLAVHESAPRQTLENGRTRCFLKADPPIEKGAPVSLGQHFWTVYQNDDPMDLKDGPIETAFDLLPGRYVARVMAKNAAGVPYRGELEINVAAGAAALPSLTIAEDRRTPFSDGKTRLDLRATPLAEGDALPTFESNGVHWEARQGATVAAKADGGLEMGLPLDEGKYTVYASAVDKTGRKFVGTRQVEVGAREPSEPTPQPLPKSLPGQKLGIAGEAGVWGSNGTQRWHFAALEPTQADGSSVPLKNYEWKISQGGVAVNHRGKDLQTNADLVPGPYTAKVTASDDKGTTHEAVLDGEVGPAPGPDKQRPEQPPLPLVLRMAKPKALPDDPGHKVCRVIASTPDSGGDAPDLSPYHWQMDGKDDKANQEKIGVFNLAPGMHEVVVTAKDSAGRTYRGEGKLPVDAAGKEPKSPPPPTRIDPKPGDRVVIRVAQFAPIADGVSVRCQLVLAPADENGAKPPFSDVVWTAESPQGQVRTVKGHDRVSFVLTPGKNIIKVKARDAEGQLCSTTGVLSVDQPGVQEIQDEEDDHVRDEKKLQEEKKQQQEEEKKRAAEEKKKAEDLKKENMNTTPTPTPANQPPAPPIEDGLRIKKTPVELEAGKAKPGMTTYNLEATLTTGGKTVLLRDAVWLIDGKQQQAAPGSSYIQVEWQDGTPHEVEVSSGKLSLKNQY